MVSLGAVAPFFVQRGESSFTITRNLDRSFVGTPASGGGNVTPDKFTYKGQSWEVWQVVPFLGSGVSPITVGDLRVHLRNRAISRDAMLLADMPRRVIAARDGWVGTPWICDRPTNESKFTSPGSGDEARRSIDYEPVRSVLANPSISGVAQGQTFTITIEF